MIRATIGILSSQGGFDADAQAFFDRVDTAGGTLSATEQEAVNQLVLDMKDDGIWSSMKAIYPMVGASSAACAQNLKSSSFTGTFTSGWTFASTGATPNGSSAYMDTNFNTSTDFSLVGLSFGTYVRSNITSGTQVYGSEISGGTAAYIQHNFSNGNMFSGNIGNIISYTPNPSTKMFVHRRTSASYSESYRDGISLGSETNTATSLPNYNFYLGARNSGGTANLFCQHEFAFLFLGLDLTNQNALDLTSAVNTFQTTLSRNV